VGCIHSISPPFHGQLYLFFHLCEDKLVKSPRKCADPVRSEFHAVLPVTRSGCKKKSCDRNVLTLWHFESACFSCCLFAHLLFVFAAQRCEVLLELLKSEVFLLHVDFFVWCEYLCALRSFFVAPRCHLDQFGGTHNENKN